MLNTRRQNSRFLPFLGHIFYQKNWIFIILEQPRYSFKNKKNIRTKNRILIFCIDKITDVNPTPGDLYNHWHPPTQQQYYAWIA